MHLKESVVKDQSFDALQIQKLLRNERFEILSISLEAGALFPKHTSPREAILVLLEGRIEFYIDEVHYELQPQETLQFAADTEHWVKALKNSKFLIIR
jgi:quercetin dioxygenase-like cupin family protein